MLELSNLSGGWGPTIVIEDVNLTLATGQTVAIIGRNGVGKTTLLELVMGRATRHAGRVSIGQTDISRATIAERSGAGLGFVPQAREVFPSLTVREHISIAARPGRWTEDVLFDLFPSLAQRRGSFGNQLSGGEQQMLAIARALSGNPSVLLMDEPSEGLAPVVIEQLLLAMKSIVSEGTLSILLVEQRVDIALELSSRCVIMDRGRIVHEGDSAVLASEPGKLTALIGLDE
jgi:branched-chain amino acid transport system ATP-binding protein